MMRLRMIGHSMGGAALLILANRVAGLFRPGVATVLPHEREIEQAREAMVILDAEFNIPPSNVCPIFFGLSEEHKSYQEKIGTLETLEKGGYPYKYYKGSRHISFMDHCAVLDQIPGKEEMYFHGKAEERKQFWDTLRQDIRGFLKENGIFVCRHST